MSAVMLIVGMCEKLPTIPQNCDVIGVDYGAYVCFRHNQNMVAAIGDFDSVDPSFYETLQSTSCRLISLPQVKNETDTEVAVAYAMEQGYTDIIVYGAFGGRIDHEMANLYLLMNRRLPITLMNESNRIRILQPGIYTIKKEYEFLSFFALEDSCLSERGVRFPIEQRNITVKDIYTVSNEILHESAEIEVHTGCVMMIESNEKKSSV